MSKSGLPDQGKSSLFVQIENLGVSAACPVVVKWALDVGFVTCTYTWAPKSSQFCITKMTAQEDYWFLSLSVTRNLVYGYLRTSEFR